MSLRLVTNRPERGAYAKIIPPGEGAVPSGLVGLQTGGLVTLTPRDARTVADRLVRFAEMAAKQRKR
jgi:hypothetical protein